MHYFDCKLIVTHNIYACNKKVEFWRWGIYNGIKQGKEIQCCTHDLLAKIQRGDVLSTAVKEYNSLDILKFVLSIFVLIIHSEIDKTYISPLLRTAVPLFFLISSYLFFSKVSRLSDEKEKRFALKHLIKRNLLLYLFWVILQLPLIIYGQHFHIDFFTKGIWNALKIILLGQSFTGSWYIIALVIGCIIIFFASKKIPDIWLVVLTLPIYIMCCFTTNYRGLFQADSFIIQFNTMYEKITQSVFNTSLPGGIFWIAVGNYLAKHQIRIKSSVLNIIFAFLIATIAVERTAIVTFGWQYLDDCYFTLILLCPIILLFIIEHQIRFKSKFRFREMSTLIFVIHGSCGRIVGYILKLSPLAFQNELIKVVLTLAVSIIASMLFLKLRDKLNIKVLKYAC